MGADILRLWVASADYRGDIAASDNIMKPAEAYRKIRNTCRFILGNIADFDYQQHRVPYEEMGELDRWALLRLHKLIARVSQAYDDFEFHVVYHGIHNFCTIDMSAVYFDIIKDRLYALRRRRRTRTTRSSDGAVRSYPGCGQDADPGTGLYHRRKSGSTCAGKTNPPVYR